MPTDNQLDAVTVAKLAARDGLLATTRVVNGGLPAYTAWLAAGFAAGLGLVLANLESVTKFIEIDMVRWAAVVMLLSIALAVASTFLVLLISRALAAAEAGEQLLGSLVAGGRAFDRGVFVTEYVAGLWGPNKWVAGPAMRAAVSGDLVYSARIIAKASQLSAWLVGFQGLLAVASLLLLVIGMKVN